MRITFLSATWSDLILCNYAVDDAALLPHLPAGLELDRYQGSAYVSLVAFEFLGTKVLGVPWPGYTNFAELNLRFYVRQGEKRGVVFIREVVPQALTAALAHWIYNEPYVAAPFAAQTERSPGQIKKTYRLTWDGQEQSVSVEADDKPHRPAATSVEHFFKEHEWGFGRSRRGVTTVYRVEHPEWDVYPVRRTQIAFDFGAVYGSKWTGLSERQPDSVTLAVGSGIKVFSKD